MSDGREGDKEEKFRRVNGGRDSEERGREGIGGGDRGREREEGGGRDGDGDGDEDGAI